MWYDYVGGGIMAMSQQEKTDYKRKFNEDSYDRIGLYLPKGKEGEPGMKDIWQTAADKEKMKLSEFIKRCVNEKISHDKGRQ